MVATTTAMLLRLLLLLLFLLLLLLFVYDMHLHLDTMTSDLLRQELSSHYEKQGTSLVTFTTTRTRTKKLC